MRVLSPRIEPPESALDGSIGEHRDALAARDEPHAELVDEACSCRRRARR